MMDLSKYTMVQELTNTKNVNMEIENGWVLVYVGTRDKVIDDQLTLMREIVYVLGKEDTKNN